VQRLPIPVAITLTSFDAGGTEHQMTELIRRLDPSRFTVHVACFRKEGPWLSRAEQAAVSLTEFRLRSFKSPSTLRVFSQFVRWCRERRIAVLHACDLYTNIFALPAAALAQVPLRIGSRRGIVAPNRTRGLLTLQRLAYVAAHRVVANSGAGANRLVEEGVPDWKVATIANGIDLEQFPQAPRRDRRRIITTVANLRPGKGHDVLLRAAARVLRRVPDACFQLVGDGPLRPELERLAVQLRISNNVIFTGHRDDVPSILYNSDIFAFPSRMEAFPNGVIEAMAAGLPVVATKVGGIPELVEHERNGLLVGAGDDRALAIAILELIRRSTLADSLARTARRTVEMHYSFEQMVSEFESLYITELALRSPVNSGGVQPAEMNSHPPAISRPSTAGAGFTRPEMISRRTG
jgi:glycosyltransferase involved in cell wall biosynthesis